MFFCQGEGGVKMTIKASPYHFILMKILNKWKKQILFDVEEMNYNWTGCISAEILRWSRLRAKNGNSYTKIGKLCLHDGPQKQFSKKFDITDDLTYPINFRTAQLTFTIQSHVCLSNELTTFVACCWLFAAILCWILVLFLSQ